LNVWETCISILPHQYQCYPYVVSSTVTIIILTLNLGLFYVPWFEVFYVQSEELQNKMLCMLEFLSLFFGQD
jgi:hypothetical protein